MSSSLTVPNNKTPEDFFNATVNLPLSSSELRDVAFGLEELARSREREDQKKFFLHLFLMQEIRATRMFKSFEDKMDTFGDEVTRKMDTVACEIKEVSHQIKGMSNDLKEIGGHLGKRSEPGETESEQT